VTHVLSYLATGLLAMYAVVLLLLWRFQERILFQPPLGVDASRVAARQVHYRAADGTALFAFLVGDCTPQRTVVLAFHGNAENARWLVPWAATLVRQTDACVVLAEYRGYDGLSGTPSYASSERDARAALDFVTESLNVSPSNVVLFGHSLGSAIAAELGAAAGGRALILQAPFTSARDMAGRMSVPGLRWLFRLISRVHFDTEARARAIATPVWVAHGDRDLVVPVRMGRQVFAAAAHPGELLIVTGAGHNDVAEIGGPAYWLWLVRAVRSEPVRAAIPGAEEKMRLGP
jgi:hypothetical protein